MAEAAYLPDLRKAIADDDMDEVANAVCNLASVRNIYDPEFRGGKLFALLADALFGEDGIDVEVRSTYAYRMSALVGGIIEGVIERLGDELNWTEAESERARGAVRYRRRKRRCQFCLEAWVIDSDICESCQSKFATIEADENR